MARVQLQLVQANGSLSHKNTPALPDRVQFLGAKHSKQDRPQGGNQGSGKISDHQILPEEGPRKTIHSWGHKFHG